MGQSDYFALVGLFIRQSPRQIGRDVMCPQVLLGRKTSW